MRKNLIYIFLLSSFFSYSQDSSKKVISLSQPSFYNEFSIIDSLSEFRRKTTDLANSYSAPIRDLIRIPPYRKWIIGIGIAATYATSFIYLNEAWYKDYPRSSFHTFNDAGEWMQVDKIGHAWTAYTTSRATTRLWRWAGVSEKNSIFLGSGTSLLYLLSIEYLDGRSAEWGWSWADVAADFSGSILFAAQELGWKEQKVQLKFSSHKKNYQPSLNERANKLFGTGFYERLLKDYNAQTYWLSFNLNSVLKDQILPDWLGISFGYGADGMFGGYENIAYDKNGNITFDRRDIRRYRQWYLAPDIDLTKIKTNSKVLRTLFFALNSFKFPAPSLELSKGKLSGHWLQF